MAAACGDYLGTRLALAALGFMTLFFGLGQAAGPSVAGAIADATDSFSSAFLLAAGVAFRGAGLLAAAPAAPGSRKVSYPHSGGPGQMGVSPRQTR